MNFRESFLCEPKLSVAKRELVHYDEAHNLSGSVRPSSFDEWMDLGVRVEVGRYDDVNHLLGHEPYDVSRFGAPTFREGLLLNIGGNLLWRQLEGSTSPIAGAGTAQRPRDIKFNNANSSIGVGTSTTAAAATQTDLQAATGAANRQFKGMANNTQIGTVAVPANAPNFPLLVGAQDGTAGTIFYYDATGASTNVNDRESVFRSTFLSGEANFTWQEFLVYNSSSITTGNTNTTDNTALDRFVSNQGTKVSGQIWEVTITFTLS